MAKLSIFNFITLNGFYKGPNEDISWNKHDEEQMRYSVEAMKGGSTLLFGRITYQMMAYAWQSPEMIKNMPQVAEGMNKAEKIVFSRTLKEADWNNTRLVKENMTEEVKRLKETSAKDLTILGSGNIIAQLAEQDLIDEYRLMINPVALGDGTPVFKGMVQKLELKLTDSQIFKNGIILACYKPVKKGNAR